MSFASLSYNGRSFKGSFYFEDKKIITKQESNNKTFVLPGDQDDKVLKIGMEPEWFHSVSKSFTHIAFLGSQEYRHLATCNSRTTIALPFHVVGYSTHTFTSFSPTLSTFFVRILPPTLEQEETL